MTITITQICILIGMMIVVVAAWNYAPVLWRMVKPYLNYSAFGLAVFIPEGYKDDKELKAVRKNIKKAKVKHKNAMLELAKKQKASEGKAKKTTKKPSKK